MKLKSRKHISNEHFHKLNWLPVNQRLQQCVTSTVFKFVQNKYLAYMNEALRSAENMRINLRNSFLKLNHLFWKTSTGKKGLSYISPAIWNRIPEIIKKTRNLNTFKHKIKHYYLNDLSNPKLWYVGSFDYALAVIKNVFLFVKQMFLHPFFSASLWLKDHNENKAIRLFCVILAIYTVFHFSNIAIYINIFFYLWLIFLF